MSFGSLRRLGGLKAGLFNQAKAGLLNQANALNPVSPPIAIDFGVSALKVLQVAAGEPPGLVAAACLDTPDNLMQDHQARLAMQMEALPKLVRHGGFKGKRAVCAIPTPMAFCKHIQIQRPEGASTLGMAQGALAGQLGCDPSALVLRHFEIGPAAGGRQEVICLATSRDLVGRLMHAIRAAKLEPVGIHSEFVATLRAFDYITKRADDQRLATLFLDLGMTSTKAMIAHGRDLVFARVIEVGGRSFDQCVAAQQGASIDEARRRRLGLASLTRAEIAKPEPITSGVALDPVMRGEGPVSLTGEAKGRANVALERRSGEAVPTLTADLRKDEPAEVAPEGVDLSEPLEILTDEISHCLRYHDSLFPGKKIDRAVFVGGESRQRGLCQHIAKVLRLPAQIADPMARVARTGSEPTAGIDLREPQPGWAVALGLCLSPTDL
ncbi:MAG: pilus assembly protein PilM [Phycisphaerales bacterium]|nr:pilus assembly protein PilM [Phycisphaerales bacterium]